MVSVGQARIIKGTLAYKLLREFLTYERYLLELEDTGNMPSLLKLTICQCIYEDKHGKSSANVPNEVLLSTCR